MNYTVIFSDRAKKQLKKFDRNVSEQILTWIAKNLQNCENPRQHGKGLVSNRSGQWRYRVGAYRIIADIQDDKVIILVLEIGHRREI